jgi:hypothetical protein
LREAGVEVNLDVVEGWPHTFWLKAPYLERAVQAESDMIEGLRQLLECDVQKVKVVQAEEKLMSVLSDRL